LVEKKDTDGEHQAKAKKALEAALKKSKEGIGRGEKRKASDQSNTTAKQPALTDRTSLNINNAEDSEIPHEQGQIQHVVYSTNSSISI
jgi:hypothetical protein